jgi:Zn-dependent protease
MRMAVDPAPRRRQGPTWAVLAAIAALGLKLKWLVGLLKLGKFAGTLISMVVTIGFYAMLFGLPFAIGFIVLLAIHEAGHAMVLKARGIPAGAPVFIPLVGASIAMKQHPPDAATEAEVGIGGPVAGTLAAAICWAVFRVTDDTFWCALAYLGFFLNLFNLIPVSPLDGGRVAGAISRWLWIPGLLVLALVLWFRFSPVLILIVLLAATQLWSEWRRPAAERARYYDVPPGVRLRLGVLYFGLAGFLGYASVVSHDILIRLGH